jgi:hypothetical protein
MISELPPVNEADELRLLVNNGDLAAANETVERLGFRDTASLFRFALAVFSSSATRSVTITNTDGERLTVKPTEKLLTPNPQPVEAQWARPKHAKSLEISAKTV